MQGSINHGLPHYRCRFPNEYALANSVDHPRAIYLRENQVVPSLDDWLARTLTPDHIEDTLTALADSQPDRDADPSADERTVAKCERKIVNYRAALDAGTDPKIITEWIAQTQAERSLAEARLRQRNGTKRLTRDQINHIVTALTSLAQVINDADPRDKTEIYKQLGLRLTYHPDRSAVRVEATPGPVYVRSVSGGGLEPPHPFGH